MSVATWLWGVRFTDSFPREKSCPQCGVLEASLLSGAGALVELWSIDRHEEDEEEKSSQKRPVLQGSGNQVSAMFFSGFSGFTTNLSTDFILV